MSSAGSDITFAATNQNVSVFGFDTSGNGYNYVGYTGNIGAPSVAHVYLFDAIFGYNFSYSNAPNVPKGTDSNYNNLMNDSQPGYYDIN